MNKLTITILLIIGILLAIALPIIIKDKSETSNQILNITATLISSISSILTLIIAMVLFKKFGIETPLLEKNSAIVFSFLEEFKKITLSVNGNEFFLFIRPYESGNTYYEQYYGEKLSFSMQYFNGLEKLFDISDSVFMPKSISNKVSRLRFSSLSMDIKEDDTTFSKVSVFGYPSEELKFGRFNQTDITLFEYLNLIDDLKSEITKWIKINSNYSPDLNL